MTRKQVANNNKARISKYKLGSGSKYHVEHASHVPDYGANMVDPNATGSINVNGDNIQ